MIVALSPMRHLSRKEGPQRRAGALSTKNETATEPNNAQWRCAGTGNRNPPVSLCRRKVRLGSFGVTLCWRSKPALRMSTDTYGPFDPSEDHEPCERA